jgi:spermidine/putrescine transport system permease protein
MVRSKNIAKWLVSGPPLLYLILFFAIPTAIMVFAAFRMPGDYGGLLPLVSTDETGRTVRLINSGNWRDYLTLSNFAQFAQQSVYIALLFKSFLYAGLTTLLCLALAYPLSWLIARSGKRWRDLLLLLVILPFWSNFLIRVYAWMIILGPQGYFAKAVNTLLAAFGIGPLQFLFTPFAVVVVLVYVHLPFMVLPLYANLEKHDLALLDAAQDLGASRLQRFWHVTWPLSLPGVYAGTALVFIPALGIFAIPELVGGTDSIMISNLIKQAFLESRDWPFGAVLSIILTGVVLLAAGLSVVIGRRRMHHAI